MLGAQNKLSQDPAQSFPSHVSRVKINSPNHYSVPGKKIKHYYK